MTIHYLTAPAELPAACQHLRGCPQLGVDLEFDDMRYRYGRHLGLVQIFDGQAVWLIDPVTIPDLAELLAVLADPGIVKVFHSCRSDILLLDELYDARVPNLVDTSVLAQLLGEADNQISLGRLIQQELGLEVDKGEQKSNWLKRPLTESQLEYAANDVIYLFELKERLEAKLAGLGRLEWARQENAALDSVRYNRDPEPWLRLATKLRIEPGEMLIFRALWTVRDEAARELDRPPYQLFDNRFFPDFIRNPPRSAQEWANVKGTHAALRRTPWLDRLAALTPDQFVPPPVEPRPARARGFKWRMSADKTRQVEAREEQLTALKNAVAAQYGQNLANLVLSNKTMAEVVELGADAVLRPWQQDVLREVEPQASGVRYADVARVIEG
ncbi:MAG: HRDC domain-containing protein [Hymenobacteraceae bacterium]|nr:HRDC domain-containing protein [Hymenobacteraceae bacterium]